MDERDRDEGDTQDFESVAPEARDYYQDSPPHEEGLLEKAREAIGGVFGGGHSRSEDAADAADDEGDRDAGAGLTDYSTSNYSPDTGRPPSDADIDDVTQYER